MKEFTQDKVEQEFLKEVSDHKLFVKHDDGLYRHLRFSKDGSSIYYRFDLVTWPGYLCICGDMGEYIFSRLEDMFVFFRHDTINPEYWYEKIQSAVPLKDAKEYDPNIYLETVRTWFDGYDKSLYNSDESDTDKMKCLRAAIEEDLVAYCSYEDERCAREAVSEFNWHGYQYHDFWECDLTSFTYRYLWCCFAIQWGIKLYDQYKSL